MPRVPVHDLQTAPAESRPFLEHQAERLGKVINLFGEMAHAPVLMQLYDTVETLLRERSSLDEATRQAIHLTVANVNRCDYCQAAYTAACRKAGFSQEQTVEIRRGEIEADARLSALLALCRQIAANSGYGRRHDMEAATDAGWSERNVLEAYADVVRTILTNYFNHMVDTELDLPAAPDL